MGVLGGSAVRIDRDVGGITMSKMHKYLPIAEAVAMLSKDGTKVGAVILGPNYEVRSLGYNGAPRGCDADEDHRLERPEKYWWMEHAERNAIYNAARVGTPLAGSTLVCTHHPCMDCARAIVQAGVKHVVTRQPEYGFLDRWAEDFTRVEKLFDECDVTMDIVL